MQYHMRGRRHLQMVEFWGKRKNQAEHSLYVRGYPPKTTEDELFQYFSQFGRVTKVALAKDQGIYAIVEFAKPQTVQYVLSIQNHTLNSQHLVCRPRQVDIPIEPPRNRFEAGYRQFQPGPELANQRPPRFFQGPRGQMTPPSLMGAGPRGPRPFNPRMHGQVDLSMMMQMDEATGLMGPGPMSLPGEPMSKKRKKKLEMENSVDAQLERYYQEETMEKLSGVKGIKNQLEWLCQNLQVTSDEAQMKFKLCETLQTTLAKYFPGCTVNQFGSSVNGFGITGCDMDIYLDLTTCKPSWSNQPVALPYVRDLKHLSQKEFGPLTPQDISRLNMLDQCKLVSRIITDNVQGVKEITVVPSQRCPLVRFRHEVSGIKCDLSVNNSLALQNTKLLYLFSVLNSRVRLLIYAVRYWAKVKDIAGNPQAGCKISNYALTLMVLCYLQNVDPPVLPTIEHLSQLHGPNNRTRIEGWDCTFAMDWQVIPSTNNTQTPAELFAGFFAHYSGFDFSNTVLTVRNGQSVNFTDFFDKENMPDGRVRHFKAAAVNVQDPFVLDQNVALNVTAKLLEKIVREFRIAAIKTATWTHQQGFFINEEQSGDLCHLLSPELPDLIKQEDQEKANALREKGMIKPRGDGDPYSFSIELKPTQLTSKFLKQLQSKPDYRVEWCRRCCAFITRVIREVVILKVEELPEMRADADPDGKATPSSSLSAGPSSGEKRTSSQVGLTDKAGASKKAKEEEGAKEEESEETKEDVEYVPEEAPLRLRKPSTADVNFQFFVRSFCRTWASRKKVKQYLTNEGYSMEGMAMEKMISETIYQNDNAPLPNAVVGFYFQMQSNISEKVTTIDIEMEPTEGEREFNCFYQFIKMFINKMVEKYLCG